MPKGKEQSSQRRLKGRNTWVRDPNPAGNVFDEPRPETAEKSRPIKVGRFKLVRNPSPSLPPQLRAPKQRPEKSRFKYERSKGDHVAGESANGAPAPKDETQNQHPQHTVQKEKKPLAPTAQKSPKPTIGNRSKRNLSWMNPSAPAAAAATGKALTLSEALPSEQLLAPVPVSQSLRPGKAKWNKYVRPEASLVDSTKRAEKGDAPLGANPVATRGAEFLKRRQSCHLKAFKRALPPRSQQAMKLLRLGEKLYSVGKRGKGRSLTLQPAKTMTTTAEPVRHKLRRPSRLDPPVTTAAASALKVKRATSTKKVLAEPSKGASSLKPSNRLKGPRVKYCPVYCQTGQCPRRGRGCPLRHDPTKRAVCTKWLMGRCERGKACPLQHQRRPELMPTCVHFLQTCCTNLNCPWLHVKVRPDAPFCAAFLRGYCAAGSTCAMKHYTLRQVKEERRLVADRPTDRGGDLLDPVSGEGTQKGQEDASLASLPRKRKRIRYFDYADEEENDVFQNLEEEYLEAEEEEGSGLENDEEDVSAADDIEVGGNRKPSGRASLLDFIQL